MKLVYVEWKDSSTTRGWGDPEKDQTTMIRSVGWLVSKTKDTLTLSTSQSKYNRFLDQLNIPTFAIKQYHKIRTYKE